MCGIIGIFHRNPGTPFLEDKELDQIAHRGPDSRGIHRDEHIALGHTRLSIIDLSDTGHQPMQYVDGRYTITYNGEIYNYLELREDLKALGERFISNSDTEVLLAAYHVWGSHCVTYLRGMFAFALWDKQEKVLFLARDRCGEKPLIYWQDNEKFIFASEFKGIVPLLPEKPDLDPCIVDMYLHYQYVPEPFTLLKGVHKLPAGHHLTIKLEDTNWSVDPVRYWSVEDITSNQNLPTDEKTIALRIREKFEESVKLTLRSDVPVCVALSGGIDSGAIAALAQKHYPQPMHAFSVGYPGRPPYDERDQARNLAEELGLIFHEVELPVNGFIDFFPELVRIMDEPIADIAAFGHYSVPKAAADLGIKVLLTGIGGDELFWGYSWTVDAVAANLELSANSAISIEPKIKLFLSKIFASVIPSQQQFRDSRLPANQMPFFPNTDYFWPTFDLKHQIYGSTMKDIPMDNPFQPIDIGLRSREDIPIAIQQLLFETWMVSNCLSLGDRVSMSVGIESRLPFLDYELIELVTSFRRISPDHAMGSKARLRRALKGILPEEVLSRPKRGFQPPVHEWMKGVIERYNQNLRTGHLTRNNIIRIEALDMLLSKQSKLNISELFFLYKLMVLEIWYQKVVN